MPEPANNCTCLAELQALCTATQDNVGGKRQEREETTDHKHLRDISTPAYATKAAKFIEATGLLGQFRSRNPTEQAEH
jgi:hypothetical protein